MAPPDPRTLSAIYDTTVAASAFASRNLLLFGSASYMLRTDAGALIGEFLKCYCIELRPLMERYDSSVCKVL